MLHDNNRRTMRYFLLPALVLLLALGFTASGAFAGMPSAVPVGAGSVSLRPKSSHLTAPTSRSSASKSR